MKVVILGPDGAGKSSVIHGLIERLSSQGHTVEMRHLKPRLVISRSGDASTVVVDPHGKPPHPPLASIAKVAIWLAEEWFANLFQDRREVLLICDRYYHDLLVDPVRYRYGGPAWIARFVGSLMPKPDLWILLDAPPEVLQARKREVTLEETTRQRSAYLAFVRERASHAVVDASQALDAVVIDAERAVAAAIGQKQRQS